MSRIARRIALLDAVCVVAQRGRRAIRQQWGKVSSEVFKNGFGRRQDSERSNIASPPNNHQLICLISTQLLTYAWRRGRGGGEGEEEGAGRGGGGRERSGLSEGLLLWRGGEEERGKESEQGRKIGSRSSLLAPL